MYESKLRDLAARGFTQTEAATELGISYSTVQNYVHEHKISFRPGYRSPGTTVSRAQVSKLASRGLLMSDIARRLKVSYGAVAYVVRKYSVPVTKREHSFT